MREVNLTAHQSVEPMLIDAECSAEQLGVAVLGASVDNDEPECEMSIAEFMADARERNDIVD